VWGGGASSDFFDTIVKIDVTTGETLTWRDGYPGEPVYVGRPGRAEEDDGVLLSVVLEPDRGASSMVVLDAATLIELARARVPHHIPFGFHGQFSRA
jgi:carotenoid cleavage dioxygenase-like enzyme